MGMFDSGWCGGGWDAVRLATREGWTEGPAVSFAADFRIFLVRPPPWNVGGRRRTSPGTSVWSLIVRLEERYELFRILEVVASIP